MQSLYGDIEVDWTKSGMVGLKFVRQGEAVHFDVRLIRPAPESTAKRREALTASIQLAAAYVAAAEAELNGLTFI